jgi:hypothetical protein
MVKVNFSDTPSAFMACKMLGEQFELIFPYGCSFKPIKKSKLESGSPADKSRTTRREFVSRLAL